MLLPHLPSHPSHSAPAVAVRPEDRCRQASREAEAVNPPDPQGCWRSEAFAEDLSDAEVGPAPGGRHATPARRAAPWRRWSWRQVPQRAGL